MRHSHHWVQKHLGQYSKSIDLTGLSAAFKCSAQMLRKILWLMYNLQVLCFNSFGFYKVICLTDFFIFNGEASFDYVLLYCYL